MREARNLINSFVYAWSGLRSALKTERNMRVHFAAAFYVLTACFVCKVSREELFALIFCIAFVLSAECFNTALENICDSITKERSEKIKQAKDVAAGAVLIMAIMSAIVGVIVFFDAKSLENALEFIRKYPPAVGLIVLTVPLWIKYIFQIKRRSKK